MKNNIQNKIITDPSQGNQLSNIKQQDFKSELDKELSINNTQIIARKEDGKLTVGINSRKRRINTLIKN